MNEVVAHGFRLGAGRASAPGRWTNIKVIYQNRDRARLCVEHRFRQKLRARSVAPVAEDYSCEAPLRDRLNYVCGDAPALQTGVVNIAYAHAVAVGNARLFYVQRHLPVI